MTASAATLDFPRVQAALAELDALVQRNALTKEAFGRIWAEVEAAQGNQDCLEALVPWAQAEDWLPASYR